MNNQTSYGWLKEFCDRIIDSLIYEKLRPHIQKAVAGKVKQLEQALKLEAHSEEIVPDMNEISR